MTILKNFAEYYQLSLEDKLPIWKCKSGDDCMSLIPNLDEQENVILVCWTCGYKMRPGIDMIRDVIGRVKEYHVRTQE